MYARQSASLCGSQEYITDPGRLVLPKDDSSAFTAGAQLLQLFHDLRRERDQAWNERDQANREKAIEHHRKMTAVAALERLTNKPRARRVSCTSLAVDDVDAVDAPLRRGMDWLAVSNSAEGGAGMTTSWQVVGKGEGEGEVMEEVRLVLEKLVDDVCAGDELAAVLKWLTGSEGSGEAGRSKRGSNNGCLEGEVDDAVAAVSREASGIDMSRGRTWLAVSDCQLTDYELTGEGEGNACVGDEIAAVVKWLTGSEESGEAERSNTGGKNVSSVVVRGHAAFRRASSLKALPYVYRSADGGACAAGGQVEMMGGEIEEQGSGSGERCAEMPKEEMERGYSASLQGVGESDAAEASGVSGARGAGHVPRMLKILSCCGSNKHITAPISAVAPQRSAVAGTVFAQEHVVSSRAPSVQSTATEADKRGELTEGVREVLVEVEGEVDDAVAAVGMEATGMKADPRSGSVFFEGKSGVYRRALSLKPLPYTAAGL